MFEVPGNGIPDSGLALTCLSTHYSHSAFCLRYEGTVWDDLAHGKGVYVAEQGLVRFVNG